MNAIVKSDEIEGGSYRLIEKIGTPAERKFMLEVMAQQLGIPARDAERIDVVAVINNATQRTIQYGWQPGIHMHVQPFNEKVKDEKGVATGETIKKYVLVDGEKAWWDSATRHRKNGVDWAPLRRDLTAEEVQWECKLMNHPYTDKCVGVYSKILVRSEVAILVDYLGSKEAAVKSIPWSAGLYTGMKTVGKYLNDDGLPAGNTSHDVALRRADKRALMQSSLCLLPVDDLSEARRIDELTESLRREIKHIQMHRLPVAAKYTDEEMAEFMDDSEPISPPPAEEPDENVSFGPTLTDKEKLIVEINLLGKKATNWESRKAAAVAKASQGSAETINELSVTQLEWIAGILRKETSATGK